jgi:hypothetical protein
MLSNLALSFSIVAGVMSCLLFVLGIYLEKEKRKSRILLLWACLFLASSFVSLEWAFWLEGYNMLKLVFEFTFPLVVYFTVWFAFIIWVFESRKERKVWIVLGILLIIAVVIAINCMNCL